MTNTVPMHANAQRPAPLYLNPNGSFDEHKEMLDKMIDANNWQGKVEPYARFISVSPQLAQHIIENIEQGRNRKRSTNKIAQYSKAMVDGEWALTGQPLIFSRSGRLLDGGHRLSGVIASEKKIRTLAVFGVADDAFSFLDIGRKRTPANTLEVLGVSNGTVKSAAMRWVYILMLGKVGMENDIPSGAKPRSVIERGFQLTNTDIRDLWLNRFKDDHTFEWAVKLSTDVGRKLGRVVDKNTLAALFFIYGSKGNPATIEKIEQFANDMTEAGARARSTAAKLVKRLRERLEAAEGRLHEVVRVTLTARALDAYLKGEQPVFTGVDSETHPPGLPTVGPRRT
jgi:hypothetical protein